MNGFCEVCAFANGTCARQCRSSRDCSSSCVCAFGGSGSPSICIVPPIATQTCKTNADCSNSSTCFQVPGNTVGYCTCQSNSDCPSGSVCDFEFLGNTAPPGACVQASQTCTTDSDCPKGSLCDGFVCIVACT